MPSRRRTTPAAPAAPAVESTPVEQTIAGYRVLRRMAHGARATLYLAADGRTRAEGTDDPSAGLVVLRVYPRDADQFALGRDIAAMSEPNGLLPRLFDVTTLPDGRACLVVERIGGPTLDALLRERRLGAGEAVTVLAPIAVELDRLRDLGWAPQRLAAAEVRFDRSGRPRLLIAGSLEPVDAEPDRAAGVERVRAAHRAFGALVDEVGAATSPPDPFTRVSRLVAATTDARPFSGAAGEYERALFAVAAPVPVAGSWDGRGVARAAVPPPSADIVRSALGRHADDRSTPTDASDESGAVPIATGRPTSGRSRATSLLRDLLAWPAASDADRVNPVTSRIADRVRDAIGSRRPVWIVAGLVGAAAAVVLFTVVPADAGSTPPEAGSTSAPRDTAGSFDVGEPGAVDASGSDGDDAPIAPPQLDAAQAVTALLEQRARCLAELDLVCVERVTQEGSALADADRAAVVGAHEGEPIEARAFDPSAISIAGRMGEAWLVSVAPGDGDGDLSEPASVLVMRTEAGWRLREIFD